MSPRPRTRLASSLAALVPALLAGCDLPFGAAGCTADVRPALLVELVDDRTGARVWEGATVIAATSRLRDSVTLDSASPMMAGRVPLAYESGGVYTVQVRHPAYMTWRREGIVVREDQCHVRTVDVRARLVPRD